MRPLVCEIRLHHLRDNYQTLKALHGGRLLAAVKANAYGHGAVECARALSDLADGFAVACLEEALELRQAGIDNPIVLLEGVFDADEYAQVDAYRLWPVVHTQAQLEQLLAHPWQQPVHVWLKMDSGMHRAGFFPHNYAAAYTALRQSPHVAEIVKMTHLACADDPDPGMTELQIETFDLACQELPGAVSIANSAALLRYPQARRDWGRSGIALYGIDPFGSSLSGSLKPVMRLSGRLIGERLLQAHEPIGYGAGFYTKRPTRVGLVCCGYADGYPRSAAAGTPVAVNGVRTRLIGRVSMDMLTIELPDSLHLAADTEIELFGDTVGINETAVSAGTIAYEVACNVKRAHRLYSG